MRSHLSLRTRYTSPKHLSTSSHNSKAHILCLPVEVRQQIFGHVLGLTSTDHLNLLCTCRLIYSEGLQAFQSRPLVFESQEELISRLSRLRQSHMDNVSQVKLAVADLDAEIVRPSLNDLMATNCVKIRLNPYQVELKHIISALAWLRRLECITIMRQNNPTRRQGPSILSDGLVHWLSESTPKLKHLSIMVDNYQLSHIQNLSYLQSLQISGFSESTPEQTQTAFCTLPRLHSLYVIPAGYIMREPYFRCQQPLQSIAPAVISSLRPLRSLTLIDPPETEINNSPFLTSAMFEAVKIVHAQSLTGLTISSLHPCPAPLSSALIGLLRACTRLRHLTIAFPDISSTRLLKAELPSNLEALDIFADATKETDTILAMLIANKLALPNLAVVTILLSEGRAQQGSPPPIESATGTAANIAAVDVDVKNKPFFTVKWRVWRPFDEDST